MHGPTSVRALSSASASQLGRAPLSRPNKKRDDCLLCEPERAASLSCVFVFIASLLRLFFCTYAIFLSSLSLSSLKLSTDRFPNPTAIFILLEKLHVPHLLTSARPPSSASESTRLIHLSRRYARPLPAPLHSSSCAPQVGLWVVWDEVMERKDPPFGFRIREGRPESRDPNLMKTSSWSCVHSLSLHFLGCLLSRCWALCLLYVCSKTAYPFVKMLVCEKRNKCQLLASLCARVCIVAYLTLILSLLVPLSFFERYIVRHLFFILVCYVFHSPFSRVSNALIPHVVFVLPLASAAHHLKATCSLFSPPQPGPALYITPPLFRPPALLAHIVCISWSVM